MLAWMMTVLLASALALELIPDEAVWSSGVSFGGGVRVAPGRAVPDGLAPRLDLHALVLQRSLRGPYTLGASPARLEVQLDLMTLWATAGATTAPRLPVSAYASWLHPLGGRWQLVLSPGVYSELGRDAIVVDERLRYRPAGTLAGSARAGLERQRWLWPGLRSTWSLRTDLGLTLSADPNSLTVARYVRVGVERSWVWGPRVQ